MTQVLDRIRNGVDSDYADLHPATTEQDDEERVPARHPHLSAVRVPREHPAAHRKAGGEGRRCVRQRRQKQHVEAVLRDLPRFVREAGLWYGLAHDLEIDDAFAGGVCRCQHCGTIQTVPSKKRAAMRSIIVRSCASASASEVSGANRWLTVTTHRSGITLPATPPRMAGNA